MRHIITRVRSLRIPGVVSRLGQRYALYYTGVALVIALAFATVASVLIRASLQGQVQVRIRAVYQSANYILATLESRHGATLRALVQHPDFQAAFASRDAKRLQSVFIAVLDVEHDWAAVTDSEGVVLATIGQALTEGETVSDWPGVAALLNGAGSRITASSGIQPIGDDAVFYLARPLSHKGQTQGILLVGSWLRSLLGELSHTTGVFLTILDSSGHTVASGLPSEILAQLPPPSSNVQQLQSEQLTNWQAADGHRYQLAYGPIQSQGRIAGTWALAIRADDIIHTMTVARWRLGILTLLALMAAFSIAYFQGVHLTHTLGSVARRLLSATEEAIQRADLPPQEALVTAPEKLPQKDELEQLSESASVAESCMRDLVERIGARSSILELLHQVEALLSHYQELSEILEIALESIWRSGDLDYVVLLLGDGDLGPYYFRGFRGFVEGIGQPLLGQECPWPLYGVAIQAIVRREPLLIEDVAREGRPLPEEFPWP
ncbi:MAG TPA: hypothetical protein EYP04_10280, partial [Anaerolineae bacterium]|nr:hypothetical protein [Anaerolineae bacterium]